MKSAAVSALRSFGSMPGVEVREAAQHVELQIQRDGITAVVVVPKLVLEWYVDASEDSTGRSVKDWCDYVGYDDTPLDQLDEDMAQDLKSFLTDLLTRPLRFIDRRRLLGQTPQLEWEIEG